MPDHDTLIDIFIVPLNNAGIKYMVTGSVASICYGEPRMTHDIDLVVMLTNDDVEKLGKIFPSDQFYIPPKEVIRVEMSRSTRGHFNIIHFDSAFKADIYMTGNDKLQLWGMANRRRWSIDNTEFWIAFPEYVIIKKLHYWEESEHEKHIRDIEAMLQFQEKNISSEEILSRLTSEQLREKFVNLSENCKH